MIEPGRIERTAQEVAEEPKKRTLPVSKAAPQKTKIFWLVAAFVVFFYLSNRGVPFQKIAIYLGIGYALYYFSFKDKENPDFILGEREAKALLYNELKYKQTNDYDGQYEIAPGDAIIMTMPAKLKKIEGKYVKWIIGFQIQKANGIRNTYTGDIDARTGALTGLAVQRTGFTGLEVQDVRFIKSPSLSNELRYLRAGGERANKIRRT